MSAADDIQNRMAADYRAFLQADGPLLFRAIEKLATTFAEYQDIIDDQVRAQLKQAVTL